MRRNHWLIVVVLLFLAWQGWSRQQAPMGSHSTPTGPDASTERAPSAPSSRDTATLSSDQGVPAEARETLRLIAADGPFPYQRDGVVFGNFEQRLPSRPRGYYHEYTVRTPGAHNRGARRIITGGQPPGEFYYSDDHYESFRAIGGRP